MNLGASERMNVVYICDNRYLWMAEISLRSLLHHNPEAAIYLMCPCISEENRSRFSQICWNQKIPIQILTVPAKYLSNQLGGKRWPPIAFVRMFMGELLPKDVHQALYIDCDTIICESLKGLWERNMGESVFAGTADCLNWRYRRNIGMKKESPYINAGILLCNVDRLRSVPVKEKANQILRSFFFAMGYLDQDVLNAVFENQISVIEAKYNVMTIMASHSFGELNLLRHPSGYYSSSEIGSAVNSPSIIHFTSHIWIKRPWLPDTNHPYAESFYKFDKEKRFSSGKMRERKELSGDAGVRAVKKWLVKMSYLVMGFVHGVLYPDYLRWKNSLLKGSIHHDIF